MEYVAYLVFALCSPQSLRPINIADTIAAQTVTIAYQPEANSNTALSRPEELSRLIFEDSLENLYRSINLASYDLSYDVFRLGMIGYYTLRQQGKLGSKNLLSIIDFTKPSTKKRFYTIDLDELKVTFNTYVAHGKNTGENMATSFSNVLHSNQSSLGFYVTGETYVGSKGYSLKLDGVERGFNDNMRERAVVMHNADYVSEKWIERYGRIGRSQGCPALPVEVAKDVINTIKHQTAIFAYYNDDIYLQNSSYLNIDRLLLESNLSARLNR